MVEWLLAGATGLAVLAGVTGLQAVRHGRRSRWTLVLMALAFFCQLWVLGIRGAERGRCPLADGGEVLVFLSWSLVLFYLVVGPAYRLSLLGLFTAPVVAVFQGLVLGLGMFEADPERVVEVDGWAEAHAAFSVLAYGAFALAAVAALMFLVLNRKLKQHHPRGPLFRNLPPARSLLDSMARLTLLGVLILTAGVAMGFLMQQRGGSSGHIVMAMVTWLAYVVLLVVYRVRGVTPRRLSLAVVGLFAVSLLVFAFV